jgi:hypothetical protein
MANCAQHPALATQSPHRLSGSRGYGAVASSMWDAAPARYGQLAGAFDVTAVEVARREVPEASFHVAATEALPFADATFDAVIMRMVVHHLDRPRASPSYAEYCDSQDDLRSRRPTQTGWSPSR